jgi:hypothetical protein
VVEKQKALSLEKYTDEEHILFYGNPSIFPIGLLCSTQQIPLGYK